MTVGRIPNTQRIRRRLVVDDAKSGNANKQNKTLKEMEWQLMSFLANSLRRPTSTTPKPDVRLAGHNVHRIRVTERCLATVKHARQKNDGLDERKRNEPGRSASYNSERRKKKSVERRRERAVLRVKSVELAKSKRPKKPKRELKPKQLNDESDGA